MRSLRVTPVVLAAGLLLAACGGSSSEGGSSSAASSSGSMSPSAPNESMTVTPSTTPSGSSSPEEVFAYLCDKATPEQTKSIEGLMKPGYKVSQLVDVRTDDDGGHAILGFVKGPGLAVLAVWTGTGKHLEGLASAEEFAAEASTAPSARPDADLQKLIDSTAECYTTLFAPQ